jgi:acetyl esterase/lipase
MNLLLTILTAFLALLSAAPFVRPRTAAGEALLWLPKLLGGALSPVAGLIGLLCALIGLARRSLALTVTGLLGAGLAARLAASMPDVDQELASLPRAGAEGRVPSTPEPVDPDRTFVSARRTARAEFQRNIVIGRKAGSGRPLRADLWRPAEGRCSPGGLGLIYAHGSGWRVGDKDQLTRPFFRRLTAQGHVVLDIAYSLWPAAGLPEMVSEVNQAILWLKDNGPACGVDPERIVLMGGSAGAHLALLAAYTPGHPAFQPAVAIGSAHDTSVRGVVAFYPPADLLEMANRAADRWPSSQGPTDRIALGMLNRLFMMPRDRSMNMADSFFGEIVGGTATEIPDTYRLLSPIYHVGAHCPPTLLLQGSDDVFELTPGVRRLHDCLCAAGVPSVLLEFPHTEHGFDLLLPRISPAARASTRAVERFLAWLERETEREPQLPMGK